MLIKCLITFLNSLFLLLKHVFLYSSTYTYATSFIYICKSFRTFYISKRKIINRKVYVGIFYLRKKVYSIYFNTTLKLKQLLKILVLNWTNKQMKRKNRGINVLWKTFFENYLPIILLNGNFYLKKFIFIHIYFYYY